MTGETPAPHEPPETPPGLAKEMDYPVQMGFEFWKRWYARHYHPLDPEQQAALDHLIREFTPEASL